MKTFFPIQIIFVFFSVLIFNPDNVPKWSRVFKAADKDSCLPLKIRVVLSANCDILNSVSLTGIPFILGLFKMRELSI